MLYRVLRRFASVVEEVGLTGLAASLLGLSARDV